MTEGWGGGFDSEQAPAIGAVPSGVGSAPGEASRMEDYNHIWHSNLGNDYCQFNNIL